MTPANGPSLQPASSPTGPHARVATTDAREQFAAQLLDQLWIRYRERVEYVRTYERIVESAGAKFHNDHIALRTIASQIPLTGIVSIARIFEALGWRAAGVYQFPDKRLSSTHYEHGNPAFPKIFISELQLFAFPADVRERVLRSLRTHRLPVSDETLARVAQCENLTLEERTDLLRRVVREFHELPWSLPELEDLRVVNQASQFAAWVLLHGYSVNHFTALINSHGAGPLSTIESTIQKLVDAEVPMKAEIEGAPGSKLRQTATEAVVVETAVADHGQESSIPWTYAYFELAERGYTIDPDSGVKRRFEGFLGPQATHLFEMTTNTPPTPQ
ncbi:MAG: DUF1338 domain-containing protein [Pirellulales bacterium]